MMNQRNINIVIACFLVVLACALRILPHAANFAPVAAVAIFSGAILPRRLALAVPLISMAASDLVIGLHPLIPLTWACYVLIALVSSQVLSTRSIKNGISLTLGSSLLFFAVTNFGVWATSGMYSHSWTGIVRCYTMALPFFRNTALSDILYTAALFGTYILATKLSTKFLKVSKPANL